VQEKQQCLDNTILLWLLINSCKLFYTMCLAIPGKIINIDEAVPGLKMAVADFGGLTRKICVEWVDAEVGDYVIAHAGMAISRVDTNEAEQALASFAILAQSLKNEAP